MKLLEPIQRYIDALDQRNFLIYCAIVSGIIVALAGFIIFWRSYALSSAEERITDINDIRERARTILTANNQAEKEQEHLNQIIDKSPDFNLNEYVNSLLSSFNLRPTHEARIETVRTDTYEERDARVELEELDMKTLVTLLQKLDEEERITVKEITIKPGPGRRTTIDVTLTIGALYKKA